MAAPDKKVLQSLQLMQMGNNVDSTANLFREMSKDHAGSPIDEHVEMLTDMEKVLGSYCKNNSQLRANAVTRPHGAFSGPYVRCRRVSSFGRS